VKNVLEGHTAIDESTGRTPILPRSPAIGVARSTQVSFTVTASPRLFKAPAKTIPTAPPGYNPHSARPTRASVQSGLQ